MSVEQAKTLYAKWIDELWHADPKEMGAIAAEISAPDFVGHWPTKDIYGPDQLAEMIRDGVSLFSSVRVEVTVGPLVEGDLVSARWMFRGVYNGEFPGSPVEAGAEVSFSGMDIMRYAEGKFSEYWVCSDGIQFMEQLGFVPKP
ncbi:ester cyclase [Nocardiopsis rhodophaea]